MNPIHERRQKLLFRLAFTSIILTLLIVLGAVGFEAYIRWFLNKDSTVLGGFELEVLTGSAFILTLGMLYLYRPMNHQS